MDVRRALEKILPLAFSACSISSAAFLFRPSIARAQDEKPQMRLKIYGFAMADIGEDFGKVGDPDWFDVLRTTKLPSFRDEFGKSPRFFAGVRQSRLGVEGHLTTSYGEMWAKFEFELFGVGVDAGQTTIRLRH